MKLPSTKFYRTHPDLDQYDDETCERLVQSALYQRRDYGRALVLSVVISALLFWGFVLSWIVYGIAYTVLENNIIPNAAPETISSISVIISATGMVVFPLVVVLPIWELWTRWCLKKHLITVRCPGCGYSLMGLEIQYDYDFLYVECPECNRKRVIQDTGLKASDIDPTGKNRPG